MSQASRSIRMHRLPAVLFLFLVAAASAAQAQKPVAGRLEEVTRLPVPDTFGEARGGTVSTSGRLALVSLSARSVIVADSSWKSFAPAGRPGEGPGDIALVSSAFWSNDSLVLHDRTLQRLSWFAGGRYFIRSVSTTDWSTSVFFGLSSPTLWYGWQLVPAAAPDTLRIVSADGRTRSPARVLSGRPALGKHPIAVAFEGGAINMGQPFSEVPWLGYAEQQKSVVLAEHFVAPSGIQTEIRVTWLAPDGRSLVSRNQVFPLARRVAGARDAHLDTLVMAFGSLRSAPPGVVATAKRELSQQFYFPAYVPPLRWMQVDPAGDAWIWVTKDLPREDVLCQVPRLGSAAVVCGAMPRNARPVAVGGVGRIVLSLPGDDGEVIYAVYRLSR